MTLARRTDGRVGCRTYPSTSHAPSMVPGRQKQDLYIKSFVAMVTVISLQYYLLHLLYCHNILTKDTPYFAGGCFKHWL